MSILVTLPGVPNPLSYAVDVPAINIANAVQGVINGYINSVVGVVSNLISQVTNALHIPGLPTLPTVPSINSLIAMVIPPGLPTLDVVALLSKYSLNALMALIVVPGFPPLPVLPDPLTPELAFPEYDFTVAISLYYANLVMYPMQLILDFILNTLGHYLGFTFPTVCISI